MAPCCINYQAEGRMTAGDAVISVDTKTKP